MGYKYKKNLKLKIVLRLQLLIAFVSIINQNIYSAAKIKVSSDSKAKDVHAQILSAIRNSNKAKLNKLIKQEGNASNALLALCELIKMDDTKGVKLLIDSGIDINIACKDGTRAVAIAAAKGHITMVKLLLEHGADINIADKSRYTPLMYAVQFDQIETAKLLIDSKADINITCTGGRVNALFIACKIGHLNMVKLLLEHGASCAPLTLKDIESSTDSAKIKKNKIEIIRLLNQARVESEKAKVVNGKKESKEPAAGNVPKESESSESYSSYLTNHNANVPVGNSPPFTQLYKGIDSGDIELVKKSLKQIPDVNCKIKIFYPNNGRVYSVYPIFQAIPGKIEIVKLLIEDRADVNITHGKDSEIGLLTPIAFAAAAGCSIETMNLLIESGADVNKASNGFTPLHSAAEQGRQAVVDALISAGANVTAQTKQGATPFSLAIANGHRGIVVSLLEQGIDLKPKEEATVSLTLNINGKSGDLIRNIIFKKVGIIDALLKMRRITEADINWQDGSGMNAIMWAIVRFPKLVIKLLSYCNENSIQPYLFHENCKGQSALSLAVKHSEKDIVNLFKSYLYSRKDLINNLLITNMMFQKINDIIISYVFGQPISENLLDLPKECLALPNTFTERGGLDCINLPTVDEATSSKSTPPRPVTLEIPSSLSLVKKCDERVIGTAKKEGKSASLDSELYKAAVMGNKKKVEFLIQCGTNVNVYSQNIGYTPVMAASMFGYEDIVQLLIPARADVNAVNYIAGDTALNLAVMLGHGKIVKLLINAKANVNAGLKDGTTPLMNAARAGYKNIAKLLLIAGADVNKINADKMKAIDFAQLVEGYSETVKKDKAAIVKLLNLESEYSVL